MCAEWVEWQLLVLAKVPLPLKMQSCMCSSQACIDAKNWRPHVSFTPNMYSKQAIPVQRQGVHVPVNPGRCLRLR